MRPAGAILTSALPVSGVRFQWDLISMKSKGAADAGTEQLVALINWADREAFLREVVGFTTWDRSTNLQRVLPLRHPLRPLLWCDEYELLDHGGYETRADLHDPANPIDPVAPAQDWARYVLTFRRPKWAVLTGAELTAYGLARGEPAFEQYRYTATSDMPQPEMRVISGFGVEYLKPGGNPANDLDYVDVPDERQAIPTYKIDLTVTWMQVPVAAVPYGAIVSCLNTVNALTITLTTDGPFWLPGTLGFKGLAKPIEKYVGADGGFYQDLCYRWTARPGGWNFWPARLPLPAGGISFQPMREKASKQPVFRPTAHQSLFTPGALA